MRRAGLLVLVLGSTACALGTSAASASGGSSVAVNAKPGVGRPWTSFRVSFRAPQQTGTSPYGGPRYELTASGRSRRGCASSDSTAVGPTRKGQRVEVLLAPPGPRHAWCRERYSGRLVEILTPECPPRKLCPDFIAIIGLGEFSFRVR
jgi:hypothetical protein